ncbi:MAG TPA: chemotaxis protein CheA [Steroidobacteraceae bacterium]|nr:chemotaxis protein CheA [Steroidobacteraceae bacterium]
MTIDLTQFHDAFFDESFEALDSMESTLLKLDTGSPDSESINTIFRVAHSIKGGAATFGFGEITSFTHSLETLLDELRGNRIAISPQICDLLLKSVDVLRAMLAATKAKQPIDAQGVADLQFDIELVIVHREGASAAAPLAANSSAASDLAAVAAAGAEQPGRLVEWQIDLRPGPQFFERGTDPVRIFRELAVLGNLMVTAHLDALPPCQDMEPGRCYLSWSLSLVSDAPEAAIREIFEWVNADCELTFRASQSSLPMPAVRVPAAVVTLPAPAAPLPAGDAAQPVPVAQSSSAMDSGSIRVGVEKIDELINTVGELVITHAMLSQISRGISGPGTEGLRTAIQQLERNMRQLQESVMRVRMLPISAVFSRFPRMVRDLGQRLEKQVDLKITGETTELDKTVLEKIGDPLVHLVRNCIDHGIESAAVRAATGKNIAGTIHMNASHRGGSICIEVSDDGGGLDCERIVAKARAAGLVGADDNLSREEIQELIFLPGFSTAEITTDVSGRGVGMDVVRRNVSDLGGKIEVQSERGRGSQFLITLPLTLAIVDGLSVAVGDQTYILPMMSTIESLRLSPTQVTTIADGREVFAFRDDYLPIIRLYRFFGLTPRARALHDGLVVVVEGAGRRVGLFVDDLLGQQQVVIKSLETNYGHVAGIAAATILGDGSVALILDVPDLIRSASRREAA